MTDDERKAIHVYARGGWKPAPSWSAARTGQQREGNVTNDEAVKVFEDYYARSVAVAAKLHAERRIPIGSMNTAKAWVAETMADEIMARIERDGAIHKSSLIEVIAMMTGSAAPQPTIDERIRMLNAKYDATKGSGA